MPQLQIDESSGRGIRLVEQFFDALHRFDIERSLSLLSDDIVYQNYPLPPQRGKRSVEKTLRLFARAVSEFDVRMHNIAERDGVVLTERTDILRGKLLDTEFWVCGTFELDNGKIRVWRDRFDVGNVLLQVLTSPLRRLL